jgi:hypothetical protein
MILNDDLRFLKESLDDTYLNDLELSKSMKKKILKKATAPSRFSRIRPKLAYFTSLVVTVSLLVILGLNIMQTDTHRGSQPTVREQQVALVHLQDDIVQLAKKQQLSERALLSSIMKNKPIQQLEWQRSQVLEDGEIMIESLGNIQIPFELSSHSTQLTESLNLLAIAYEKKNEYYQKLDLNNAPSLSLYTVPVEEFIYFQEKIDKVYLDVNLLPVNYQMLINFLMGEEELE